MTDIKNLTKKIKKFRDERNWEQFHNSKDCAIALVSEAVEVLDHFKWKNRKEIEDYLNKNRRSIGDELADVLYWVILMANDLKIDLTKAFQRKMKQNEKKYPIAKAKGKHTKYNQL